MRPNQGQPICLVTNLSAATTIAVSVEIFDATGTSVASTTSDVPPGAVDAATDLSLNFYTYCRITPQDASQLPLLRGNDMRFSSLDDEARQAKEALVAQWLNRK